MPVFTIEMTYRLPIYRQRTYEAETVEQAGQHTEGEVRNEHS